METFYFVKLESKSMKKICRSYIFLERREINQLKFQMTKNILLFFTLHYSYLINIDIYDLLLANIIKL